MRVSKRLITLLGFLVFFATFSAFAFDSLGRGIIERTNNRLLIAQSLSPELARLAIVEDYNAESLVPLSAPPVLIIGNSPKSQAQSLKDWFLFSAGDKTFVPKKNELQALFDFERENWTADPLEVSSERFDELLTLFHHQIRIDDRMSDLWEAIAEYRFVQDDSTLTAIHGHSSHFAQNPMNVLAEQVRELAQPTTPAGCPVAPPILYVTPDAEKAFGKALAEYGEAILTSSQLEVHTFLIKNKKPPKNAYTYFGLEKSLFGSLFVTKKLHFSKQPILRHAIWVDYDPSAKKTCATVVVESIADTSASSQTICSESGNPIRLIEDVRTAISKSVSVERCAGSNSVQR